MWQSYSTDPRANIPTIRKPLTRSGFTLADTISDANGVAYSDKVKLAPEEIAQHGFAGPDMEAFGQSLAGKRAIMNVGGGRVRSLGREPMVPAGGDDGGYQNAVNAYLSELTDRNAAGQAAHDAAFANEQKQSEIDRAMAIANTPNVSQNGRPIVAVGPMGVGPSGRPVSASGTYVTAPPDGAPVNRQAIAAQMAPGLIAPPAAAPPVTFGTPIKATVNGKSVFVRPGSDGQTYDMSRKPIADISPAANDNEPLVSIMGPDNRPILVPRSEAVGKSPASSREQGRPVTSGDASDLADFDTSKDELAAVRAAISSKDSTGIVARIGATIPYVTQITGWGSDAKKRQAVIDRVKQVIGKTLEGGVLRKEDEAKYEKILPNIGDAPDVATAKLNGLDAAIDKRKQRRLDALKDSGYETSHFEARGGKAANNSGTIRAIDPSGNVHEAKAGTPLPAGWKLEGG